MSTRCGEVEVTKRPHLPPIVRCGSSTVVALRNRLRRSARRADARSADERMPLGRTALLDGGRTLRDMSRRRLADLNGGRCSPTHVFGQPTVLLLGGLDLVALF